MHQKLLKLYLVRVFLISLFALHLIMLYELCNNNLGQIETYYGGILLFHTPVWIVFIIIGEMLLRAFSKINYKLLLTIFGMLIVLQLSTNSQKSKFNFDFLALYHIIDYLFCTTLLSLWEKKRKQNL